MSETGYSGTKAATIVGITYRQLDYWARTDLIRPSLADASGSGSRRLYSYRDLLELRVIKSLLDAGIKLESVRTAFEYLRDHVDTDIASAHLVISGSDVILCDGEQLIDVMRRGGQGVLNVLAIGGVKSDLDSTIVDLGGPSSRSGRLHPPRHVMGDAEHSPLDAVHRRLDAKMVPFGGWEMPLSYPLGTLDEHLACRNDAVVFDVSHLGTVRVEGTDADERLQFALTNDLYKIAPGRAQYTHLLDEVDASVLDDIIVWWVDDEVFDVMPNASNTDRVRAAIGGVETTHDRAVLAVQGPRAKERLATVFPEAAAVGRFRVAALDVGGRPVRGRRHRLHGRGRRRDRRSELRRSRPVGRPSPVPASRRPAWARATRCVSRPALPLHGHELGAGITSLQAGLGWVVAWSKDEFRGREPLAAERAAGVSRLLMGIATEGRRPPRADCSVLIDGQPIGIVTSGNFSPVLGHGIALAFMPPSIEVGTDVVVDVRGTGLAGRVVATPFVAKH